MDCARPHFQVLIKMHLGRSLLVGCRLGFNVFAKASRLVFIVVHMDAESLCRSSISVGSFSRLRKSVKKT